MDESRRTFLKIAGLSGLSLFGLGISQNAEAFTFTGTSVDQFQPGPNVMEGKRWAMVVIPKKCKEGCTKCIDACHAVHNVPDFGNKKDEIKWIWRENFHNAFPGEEYKYFEEFAEESKVVNNFLVFCNHCDNPPCVRACPTKATFKRADGVVMMDFHRCIGCRYCMAACPFGARSLNWRDPRPFIKKVNPEFPTRTRGVVEKCNFCAERLAKGQMPACVEACPHGALLFGDLEDSQSEVREILKEHHAIRRKAHLGTQPQVYYIV